VPPQNSEQAQWFAEEVQPHESALRGFIRGRFPDLRDIDDLIQETYARFFRARSLGKIDQPRAYLFATARNAALDYFRRNRSAASGDLAQKALESVVEEKPNAAENASLEQEKQILAEAIEELPPRCREVLRLRCFQNLSYREVAEKLGITVSTVHAQLTIAMVRCRQNLMEKGLKDHRYAARR
jgi:RNA polymerase sigma factor (sigma-70 family)